MYQIDKNENDGITFDEFKSVMTGRMHQKDSKEEIMKIFSLFDEDNQGKISFRNLKKIAQELGETLSDEDLYISHVDNVNFTRL